MPDFPIDPDAAVRRLADMQAEVRRLVVGSRDRTDLMAIDRSDEADTIYAIDAVVEPAILEHCEAWARRTPLVLIAEGVLDEDGREGERVFPAGTRAEDAAIRVIIDPIDGTRGLMYDKRPAWALAGVAPNRGADTRLRDCFAAAMTELPTSKMGRCDVLTATKGGGAVCRRIDLAGGGETRFTPRPSTATSIEHGFASITNFFPGTKRVAAELSERIAAELLGEADVGRGVVFEDQYISTGGQWYEVIVGHDRLVADLRPAFYRHAGLPEGLCCHPYDCAALLVAEEAGAVVTDAAGRPLDAPLDLTTGLDWVAYANAELRRKIEPIVRGFLNI